MNLLAAPVVPVTLVVLVTLVAPAGLLLWLSLGRERSRRMWTLKATTVLVALTGLAMIGGWHHVSYWLRLVWLGLYPFAVLGGWRRAHDLPRWQGGWRARARVGVMVVLLSLMVVPIQAAVRGRLAPDEAVDLRSPFREGRFLAVSAGGNVLVNPHRKVLGEPGLEAYAGQAWGVDFVRLDDLGRRATGLYPSDPERYHIFGTPVYAPCSGLVLRAENDLPDLRPPATDRENLPGNHVLLQCGDVQVLLAHFAHGSVRVEAGQTVGLGEPLGRVGNSGNTSEPHLHLHAQAGGKAGRWLDARPLPFTIDGQHLAQNDLLGR